MAVVFLHVGFLPLDSGAYVRITSKGQVTIPVEIREKFGLLPYTEVEFVVDDGAVKIVPRPSRTQSGRGAEVVRRLRGTASGGMSTEEIMALTRDW